MRCGCELCFPLCFHHGGVCILLLVYLMTTRRLASLWEQSSVSSPCYRVVDVADVVLEAVAARPTAYTLSSSSTLEGEHPWIPLLSRIQLCGREGPRNGVVCKLRFAQAMMQCGLLDDPHNYNLIRYPYSLPDQRATLTPRDERAQTRVF
jgi:hypothetical protein